VREKNKKFLSSNLPHRNLGPFAPMVAQFMKKNIVQIEMLLSILQEHFDGKL
jgi:hypothetical protein